MGPADQVQDSPPSPPGSEPPHDIVREQDKMMLVFAYISLLALIPLLTVNDSDFVRWHAKNGLVLSFGGGILLTILGKISFIRWFVPLAWMVLVALIAVSIFRALQGARMRIPLVTDLAEKF